MKVFFGWSGPLARQLGEIFREWLPSMLQMIKVYFTPEDIAKGSRWYPDIAKELEESNFGILFVTKENLKNDWMAFEAGALSKKFGESYVCPILFDVKTSDLEGPLTQFQAVSFNKTEMKKLVKNINDVCGENKLNGNVIDKVFNKWWDDLENKVKDILEKYEYGTPVEPKKDERKLLEEIWEGTREINRRMRISTREYIDPTVVKDLYNGYIKILELIKLEDVNSIYNVIYYMLGPLADLLERLEMGDLIPQLRDKLFEEKDRLFKGMEGEEELPF